MNNKIIYLLTTILLFNVLTLFSYDKTIYIDIKSTKYKKEKIKKIEKLLYKLFDKREIRKNTNVNNATYKYEILIYNSIDIKNLKTNNVSTIHYNNEKEILKNIYKFILIETIDEKENHQPENSFKHIYKVNSFITVSKYTSDEYDQNNWQILNFSIQGLINLSEFTYFGIQTGIFREISGGSDFSIYDIPIVPFLALDVGIIRFQFGFGYYLNIRNYYSASHTNHNFGYFFGVDIPISITKNIDLFLIFQRHYIIQEYEGLATIKFGAGVEYKIF